MKLSEEKIIKDVVEIVELAKKEIESNDENITATLDLTDLKSLKNLLDLYNKQKQRIKSLEQENVFLKQIYSRTEEFKSIERLANNE